MIKFCGRRILCHPDFRVYLSVPRAKPNLSPSTASNTTLVNFGSSSQTLVDDLLIRAFARIRQTFVTFLNDVINVIMTFIDLNCSASEDWL